MRRIWCVLTSAAIVLSVGTASDAKPKVKLPKITGGGVAQNFNAGDDFPLMFTHLGFTAHATGAGALLSDLVDGPNFFLDVFEVDPTIYPAKGQIQLKNVAADDPSVTVSKLHGVVVCIANLGPSGMVDGDDPSDDVEADPLGDVWEIRFEITKVEIGGEEPVLPDFPIYGSIYVQDGGQDDFVDENFEEALLASADCAVNPFFGLEPLIHGNITVHDE